MSYHTYYRLRGSSLACFAWAYPAANLTPKKINIKEKLASYFKYYFTALLNMEQKNNKKLDQNNVI